MDLSVALIIAASFAILCTFYIGKRILTISIPAGSYAGNPETAYKGDSGS